MKFADVTESLKSPELHAVLALSVGNPSSQNLTSIAEQYGRDPFRAAFALIEDDLIVAIAGLEFGGPGTARLRHLAVRPCAQRSGLGRKLILEVANRNRLEQIVAETDRDALGFYTACGFSVVSLGELYPGVERFECSWRAA